MISVTEYGLDCFACVILKHLFNFYHNFYKNENVAFVHSFQIFSLL